MGPPARIVDMDGNMAGPTKSVPKKWSKGKTHVPRAPKPRTAEQLLADEKAAHTETCGKLDAALALLKTKQQECSNSTILVQTLQQQLSGLSAELRQKEIDLQLISSRMAQAHDTAAALNATASAATVCVASLQQQLQGKDARLSAAEAGCKQAVLNDLAAQQAATSKIAFLKEQLAVTQDSLAQLQHVYQAAQDDLAVLKAARAAADAHITGLELHKEKLAVSLLETQRRFELVSADLAVHKAAARTAESSIESLHVQLQYSSSRCAELHAANDDLAWQASVAAAAASNRVRELEGELQHALAKLQQLRLANEASLEILTDIAAGSLVSQAAHEFAMGKQLKAADTAGKAQRDKFAVRDAEVRACKWQLAKSETGTKRLQQEVAQLHQQLAVAAEGTVHLNVKLQTVVSGHTAATAQIDEAETAAQVVRCELSVAQQKLADAQDQLFGWACAAAATALLPSDLASSCPDPKDGVCSSPAPTVLQSNLASPAHDHSGQHSPTDPIEARWKPVFLQPFTNVPQQQIPASDVSVCYEKIPSLVSLAAIKATSHNTASKPATRAPKLYKSLNQIFQSFVALCSGGLSKGIVSPQALGEICHNPVANSSLSSQRMSTVPSHSMSLHGTADLGGYSAYAAGQERYCAAAKAAADVTGTGISASGSTSVVAVSRLSRWGSAAAGAGDAGCNSPRASDTAVKYNFTGSQSGAEDAVADAPVEDIAATHVCDDAVDWEAATVTVIEWSAGTKAGLMVAPAMTDVGAVAS